MSEKGEQRGRGPHRDVSGGRLRAPGGGHHGGAVGQQGFARYHQRAEQKNYVHIEDWRNRPLQGGRYPCDRAAEPGDPPQNPRGRDVP